MMFEVEDDGGVLIVGSAEELRSLADDLEGAADEGEVVSVLLKDSGVAQIVSRREE